MAQVIYPRWRPFLVPGHKLYTTMELVPVPLVPTCAKKWVYKAVKKSTSRVRAEITDSSTLCTPFQKSELSVKNSLLFHVCVLHPCSVFLDVYSVLFFFCLTSCVYIYHLSHGPFAGVSSNQTLPGFLITTPPLGLFLLYLAR